MIAVTLRLVAHPEARKELLRRVREDLFAPTRAEAGCLNYRFYQHVENENAFSFVEEWRDWGSLNAHFRSAPVGTFLAAIGDLLAEAPVGRFHEVKETRGMEALAEARAELSA